MWGLGRLLARPAREAEAGGDDEGDAGGLHACGAPTRRPRRTEQQGSSKDRERDSAQREEDGRENRDGISRAPEGTPGAGRGLL